MKVVLYSFAVLGMACATTFVILVVASIVEGWKKAKAEKIRLENIAKLEGERKAEAQAIYRRYKAAMSLTAENFDKNEGSFTSHDFFD